MTLGVRSKGLVSWNFIYGQFQRYFYQTLFVVSQINGIIHVDPNFYSVTWVMPQGWVLGVLMGQKSNSVPPSVRYAISSLTIGRNLTKFDV